MNAFIGGTSLLDSPLFESWDRTEVHTPYGEVLVWKIENYVFLQRHGQKLLPPHVINHLANVWTLKSMKVKKIVAVNSVGSLQQELRPGTFVVPDDFFSPCTHPTFFDKEMRFTVPHLNDALAKRLYKTCCKLDMDVRLGGVYVQAVGPRLETKAEINFFRNVGHIVGMTLASEATLCIEQGIPYASICSIDNYCNGITSKPLDLPQIVRNSKKSRQVLERLIATIIRENGP